MPGTDAAWSSRYAAGYDYRLISWQAINSFLQYAGPTASKTALDIGCGTGQLSRELYHRGYVVTGVDTSAKAVEIAQSLTVVPEQQLRYIHLDIEHAKESLGGYGLITCKLVYAFMQDKRAFLDRVAAMLEPTGQFVVITPLRETVPPEKAGIAVSNDDVQLLEQHFRQIARYTRDDLLYFVGAGR